MSASVAKLFPEFLSIFNIVHVRPQTCVKHIAVCYGILGYLKYIKNITGEEKLVHKMFDSLCNKFNSTALNRYFCQSCPCICVCFMVWNLFLKGTSSSSSFAILSLTPMMQFTKVSKLNSIYYLGLLEICYECFNQVRLKPEGDTEHLKQLIFILLQI